MFINVEIDAARISPELAQALVKVCPVDIFSAADGRLAVQPEQEDECTLCALCLAAAPVGVVAIHKLYSHEVLVSRREPASGDGLPMSTPSGT